MKKNIKKLVSGIIMFALTLMLTAPFTVLAGGLGGTNPTAAPTPKSGLEDTVGWLAEPGDDGGTFQGLEDRISPIMASAYSLILKLGIGCLVIAGIVAGVCFGILKDSQAVREHKTWLVRIIISVLIVGAILGLVGFLSTIKLF